MKETEVLQSIISNSNSLFNNIEEEKWNEKANPAKRSKKEILGHLCDSAMNNIRRFVVSQYEQDNKILYAQNAWVTSQDYQHSNYKDIIQLWKLLNEQLTRIWEIIPPGKLLNTCITDQKRTLQWLIGDYIVHLNHHLDQIFNRA